jgi:putative ABC transport system substrate-binding protein
VAGGKRRGGEPVLRVADRGLQELGYVDGRTITLEHRFPDEKPALFTRMAAELVSLKPDVLVGVGSAAVSVKRATATVPTVFMYVPDPVGAGLAETVRRPGGNATGMTNFAVDLSDDPAVDAAPRRPGDRVTGVSLSSATADR